MAEFRCKYAFDKDDEYCKTCDGITMDVDGNKIPCKECAGYEKGEEVRESPEAINPETMNEPDLPFEEDKEKSKPKTEENKKPVTSTPKEEKPKTSTKNATNNTKTETKKVSEEKKQEEKVTTNNNGKVKVVSLRYTSSATIKKGDNYFKFSAEEEWDVSDIDEEEMQDTREKLWATLNNEVDSQIEELNNMK